MNKKILENAGFKKEIKMIGQGCCPICNSLIDLESFRDELSRKEFKISGMCQVCQDKVFN